MTAEPGPTGPRRLKDDPDFRWETGCDLGTEASVVGGYDLASTKDKLLASIAVGALPSAAPASATGGLLAAIKPGLAVLALVGAVGGAFLAGLHAGAPPSPVEAPAVEIVAPDATLRVTPARVDPSPGIVEPRATEPDGIPPELARVPVAAPLAPPPAGSAGSGRPEVVAPPSSATVEDVASVAVEAVEPAPPASDPGTSSEPGAVTAPERHRSPLEREMDMYDAALDALGRGSPVEARDGFRAYLATWPRGTLRAEAQLGLLQALHATRDAAGAERLASEIQDLPEFSGRRTQILRLRAESLVVLERCDEAVAMVEALPSKEGSEVRRACRGMRREGP